MLYSKLVIYFVISAIQSDGRPELWLSARSSDDPPELLGLRHPLQWADTQLELVELSYN